MLRMQPAIERQLATRPHRVKLNRKHTLYQGLKFAAIGNLAGSNDYISSALDEYGGTLANGATWENQLSRPVVYFDETLLQYVGLSPTIPVGPNHTISLWVYDDNSTGTTFEYCALVSESGSDAFFFRPPDSGEPNSLNYYYGGASHPTIDNVITQQTWHHVLGRVSDGNVEIYVDGESVQLQVPATGFTGWNLVRVGSDVSDEVFNGYIGDLLIYDRPIASSEIATLSNRWDLTYDGFVKFVDHDHAISIIEQQVDVQSQIFRSRLIRGGI